MHFGDIEKNEGALPAAGFLMHLSISQNQEVGFQSPLCVPYLVTQGSNQPFQITLLMESHLLFLVFLLQLHLHLTELWAHVTEVSTLE